MDRPLINYTDPIPFITGRAGFRVHDTSMRFDNFVLTPAEQTPSAILLPSEDKSSGQTDVLLYDLQGRRLNTRPERGMYIDGARLRVK